MTEDLLGALRELQKKYGFSGVIDINYDGSGDSGAIENIEITPEDEEHCTNEADDALRDWAYSYLETYYGGWEINEGSCGTITLDFKAGVVKCSHGNRIEVIEHEDREDKLPI